MFRGIASSARRRRAANRADEKLNRAADRNLNCFNVAVKKRAYFDSGRATKARAISEIFLSRGLFTMALV